MSSSSDDDGHTLQERQENAVLAYELLCHHELLRDSGFAWPSAGSLFKQVCDELEAIYRNDGVWLTASKKFQAVVAEGTLAAVDRAAGSAAELDYLGYLGRTAIRALNQGQSSRKRQKKHKTRSIVAYRDACIMSRRRRPRCYSDGEEQPYLPPELLAIVFGFLQSPIDLASCRSVCVDWLRAIDSHGDVLWPPHLYAMVGRSKGRELLSQIRDRGGRDRASCPELALLTELVEQRPGVLAPFRYNRFILVTGSSYFLKQMNEATFQRLLRTESDKGLHERRCFVSPGDVAAYVSRPEPATLRQLARQG